MKAEEISKLRETHKLKPSDITICTYPKCGTTLMQQVVLSLLADGDLSKVKDPMGMSKWAEATVSRTGVASFTDWQPDPTTQRKPPARRVVKTHAPVHLKPWGASQPSRPRTTPTTPANNPSRSLRALSLSLAAGDIPEHGKVVVITRNPADAAVSMHNHARDVPLFQYSGAWYVPRLSPATNSARQLTRLFLRSLRSLAPLARRDHFFPSLFLPGLVESGCFWAWHAGWWEFYGQNIDRVLWLSYEDFKMDPRGTVTKVAKFIDCSASKACIERTVDSSSFENMRRNAEEVDKEKEAKGEFVKKNHIR
jgi:hypothetical protein